MGTLEAIGVEIAKVFQPFKDRVENDEILLLLAELGIEFPASLAADTDFQNAVSGVADKVGQMPERAKELIDALEAEDYTLAGEALFELIQLIAGIVDNFQTIADEINANGPYPGLTAEELGDFVTELALNIIDYLIINYFQNSIPLFTLFLEFFGLVEERTQNEGSTNPVKPEYLKKSLHLDRIPTFLENPAKLAQDLYGWGGNDLEGNPFTGHKLFPKLEKILQSMGWPAVYDDSGAEPELDLLLARMVPRTDLNPRGIELIIEESISGGLTQTFDVDKWSLEVGFSSGLGIETSLVIQPNGNISIRPPADSGLTVEGDAFFRWIARDNVENLPLLIFGTRDGSRLEAMEISALFGAELDWDVVAMEASASATVEMAITEGKVVIKPGNPDGFLANVLPPDGFSLIFDLLVGLNSAKGFYFSGSGTLEFDIPVSVSIGPISLLNLTLGLTPGSEFKINAGADIRTELGPFVAIVENMGVSTVLTFPDDRKGNLGPANLDIGFKPPNGIGMSLDAGVVKGGGYLFLDFEKGQYAGALELDFQGLFGFTAIGIITTKFPDGSEGFSLLLLINVTFDTPITLGFNFYLAGIGGIIGLHRTISTRALQEGVKDGSVDNILFPENVIANITRIISDLEAIFPTKRDQFVLGIMARITWNTPAVLTVEAGLVVEFPSPFKIVILGVIRCALPTADEAILELNVAFAGIIDFENKILMFDASIFDSRILTITLEGDMALRISWGDKPDFLVSVGGFHPAYTPGAHLQLLPMRRITVNILSGNPNLVLTTYFAVTTNTIQFGAALDFSFRVSKFGVYGNFGFDVLIQFSPFRFIAGVRASVSVKLGSATLFSIGLEFNLEGPTPWRAHGYASFRILFVKFKVKFDKTWGEKRENSLPPTSVLPLLLQEIEKNSNWDSKPALVLAELVTLADIPEEEPQLLVKPNGSLEVNQSVVPLDLTMSKFGNYRPDDISRVTVRSVRLRGEALSNSEYRSLKNSFAPAAYKEMADQDKLKAPSYENQNSGTRITVTDERTFDYGINRLVEYESIISDYEEEPIGRLQFRPVFFKGFVSGGAVGQSYLSRITKQNQEKASKVVSLAGEQYAVVSNVDLSNIHGENQVFNSKSEADEFLKATVAANPKMKGKVQLSPAFQMA